MTDHEQEIIRLHAFILRMAERLAAASEVLGNRAERRQQRKDDSMETLTPPIKWHGGKQKLAQRFIELMPPRCKNPNKPDDADPGWLHYCEPYAGGLGVLLANDPEGISEVANDINGDLTNFWEVLQGHTSFNQFMRLVQAVPFSQKEFDSAKVNSIMSADGYGEIIYKAATFFIRCRQSLSGRMKGFTGITRNRTRRAMNAEVSAWLNAIEGLPDVHARLMRVLILNKPALEVIRKEDGPRTLFYLDPPYLHSTRATTTEYGENEMTPEQHRELLTLLNAVEGRFLLSGYHSEMYDEWAYQSNFKCHEFEVDNKASGGKTKRRMVECVWCNFLAAETLKARTS